MRWSSGGVKLEIIGCGQEGVFGLPAMEQAIVPGVRAVSAPMLPM